MKKYFKKNIHYRKRFLLRISTWDEYDRADIFLLDYDPNKIAFGEYLLVYIKIYIFINSNIYIHVYEHVQFKHVQYKYIENMYRYINI